MRISYYVLILLTVITPWINAGMDLPVRPFLYGLLCVGLLSLLLDCVRTKRWPRVNFAFLLMALGMALAGVSLIPLPLNLMPATSLALWSDLTNRTVGTLSLHPSETRVYLSMLCALATSFFIGCQLRVTKKQLHLFSLIMLVNGTLLTLFAFVQKYSWNGALYWTFALPDNETVFGPIVYHNIAGAYLVICLAIGSIAAIEPLTQKRSLSQIDGWSAAMLLMLATIVVGLFCTLSRGAILSAAAALLVVGYCFVSRAWNWKRLSWSLPFLLFLAALMFWFGMSDAVVDRLGTLTNGDVLEDQRLLHWTTALRALPDFWTLGCGAGAYGRVVSLYESYDGPTMFFRNAHNQYLETLLSNGVIGLGLMVLLLVASVTTCWKLSRRWDLDASIGFVGLFLILAAAVHAFVDFCLLALAVSLPLCFVLGLVYARLHDNELQSNPRKSNPRKSNAGKSYGLVSFAATLLIVSGMVWATFDGGTAARVALATKAIPWGANQAKIPLKQIERDISRLEEALRWRPDSLSGQEAMGTLQVIRYRQQALDQLSKETQIDQSDPNLWQWTSPELLHHRIHTLRRKGKQDVIEELRTEPTIARNLGKAREAFLAARYACPLWANVHLRLEELNFLDPHAKLEDTSTADRISRLAMRDPRMLFECGNREFGAGRYESAYKCWNLSLQASPQYLKPIAQLSLSHLNTTDLLNKVIPADAGLLSRLDAIAREDAAIELAADGIIARAQELVIPRDEMPTDGMTWFHQAELAELLGDHEQYVRYLERALQLLPNKTPWRYALARKLVALSRFAEAEKQMVRCVRQKNWRMYHEFLKEVRVQKRAAR